MTVLIRSLVALALAGALALPAAAQVTNRVEAKRDWSVFVAGEGAEKVCWIATRPKKSVALRGGKQVQVNRGEIFLMVAVRPDDGARQEVSFTSGYPFKEGSTVEVEVGSSTMTMFTTAEFPQNAWPPGPEQDAEMVGAFRKGLEATVEGVSSRGTTTVDTFSLLGFTAALESAQRRCGG